jgi:hypothetical protein
VIVESGQCAVVEGWKFGRLLLLFGVANNVAFRDWVDMSTVMFWRHWVAADGPL